MKYRLMVVAFLSLLFVPSLCLGDEITAKQAIEIAKSHALSVYNYNAENVDVEVLRVKKGVERGPIRILWLMHTMLHEDPKVYWDRDFWVVYLYTKNLLNNPTVLGGSFVALVDLYTGEVFAASEGE